MSCYVHTQERNTKVHPLHVFLHSLIMYLAANLPLIFTYHVVWSIVYMLQWAQGYGGNSEQRQCNFCTDGMFDNMHNNELTEVVVHSTQAGQESWPSWCAAQKIVALAREWADDRNWQTHFSTVVTQEAGFRFYLSMKKQSHFVMLVENLEFSIDLFLPSQFLRQEAIGTWHSSFCVKERSNCRSTTIKSLS